MKKLVLILCLFCAPLPALFTGCQPQVTLEAGGAYNDPVLATTDRSILDASHTLTAFLQWNAANADYLARWPEVGALAAKVSAQKDGWIRDAYAARDAYAQASAAYKSGFASMPPDGSKLNAALALLTNITSQIVSYQNGHPSHE